MNDFRLLIGKWVYCKKTLICTENFIKGEKYQIYDAFQIVRVYHGDEPDIRIKVLNHDYLKMLTLGEFNEHFYTLDELRKKKLEQISKIFNLIKG